METVKFAVQDEALVADPETGALLLVVVESIDGDSYTVRVLAESGEDKVPTDRILTVTEADLVAVEEKEVEIEISVEEEEEEDIDLTELETEEPEADLEKFMMDEPAEEPSPAEPTAPEADPLALNGFVEYQSAAGKVVAKIVDVVTEGEVEIENGEKLSASADKPVYKLEIYEPADDESGLVASGIMACQYGDVLKACAEPKIGTMKRLPRFVAKLKKAEVSVDEESATGYVKGYLSIFDNVDLGGDVVKYGAFSRTLTHKGGKTVFMLDHGWKTLEVLGALYLEEDEKGLKLDGHINLKTSQGRDAFETIKFQAEHGIPLGASIGYDPKQFVANKTGGYDLTEVELWEGSVTPFPMNQEALITEASKRFNRAARAKRAHLYQLAKM